MANKRLDCILVEDKKSARELIELYISETDHLNLLLSCTSFKDAIERISDYPEAVLFLDIFLKSENTIQILEKFIIKNPIIFITGHKEFAHNAFELDAIDYLIKPITRRQFDRSILKLNQRIQLKQLAHASQEFIIITEQRIKYQVSMDDILYIESDKEYCIIHVINRVFRSKITLKSFEDKLPVDKFCKIHRSFIVNPIYIKKVFKNQIEINNTLLPISRTYKSSVRRYLL